MLAILRGSCRPAMTWSSSTWRLQSPDTRSHCALTDCLLSSLHQLHASDISTGARPVALIALLTRSEPARLLRLTLHARLLRWRLHSRWFAFLRTFRRPSARRLVSSSASSERSLGQLGAKQRWRCRPSRNGVRARARARAAGVEPDLSRREPLRPDYQCRFDGPALLCSRRPSAHSGFMS